jgi:cytochrome c peroxidase
MAVVGSGSQKAIYWTWRDEPSHLVMARVVRVDPLPVHVPTMTHRFWKTIPMVAGGLALAGCRDVPSAVTSPLAASAPERSRLSSSVVPDAATAALVRQLAAGRGIVPLPPSRHVRPALSRLGQALLFDPILSGNRNISCSSCHLPAFAMGDGLSLSIGEGGVGVGPERTHPQGVFIARNAPPLFNLGAMQHLFWDGRIQADGHGGVSTPAGAQVTPAMARVFEYGPVSALAMFPVTNRAEMRGLNGNELAAIPDADNPAIWAGIMRRLGAIPEYREMFEAAYPEERFSDMSFAHASNAIGGFLVERLTFANTPWDRFLAGSDRALSPRQMEGARTFLTLKCSICHTGATLSDEKFHDVAVAQIGSGEGDGAGGRDDFGRMRVTGDPTDRYRFRTSPLRNVELTAPYGHDGSIASLRAFVEHYSESDLKLLSFDAMTLPSSLRGMLLPTSHEILLQRDPLITGVVLTPDIVDKLMAYMGALTDDAARDLTHLVPRRVPSRLAVVPGRR